MKVSDYIALTLKENGIEKVFGFQGSNVTHLINSIYNTEGIEYIQNNHEQASAFAACAYSEVTNNLGAAISSSGPGAINMISGIANAWLDSVPVVFLTGQLNSKTLSPSKEYRQHGFQEFNIVETVKDFTKYAVTVLDPLEIKYHLEKAIYLAKSDRKGGVLLDLPHNIQTADVDIASLKGYVQESEEILYATGEEISESLKLIKSAKRPLVLLGGGAKELRGSSYFYDFLSYFDLPVVASLRGLDVIPHNSKHFFGFIGSYGNRYANIAVSESDLLIVLGSRLDFRQIGDMPNEFAKNAKIIHVDISKEELNHNITPTIAINCSCSTFIRGMYDVFNGETIEYPLWFKRLNELKRQYPIYSDEDTKTLPNEIIYHASRYFTGEDVITGDVGQNQMWTAQSVSLMDSMRLLNSAGLGSMGYSLPAAIGAAMAKDNIKVLSISGDGGIQMNIQELATVRRHNLPIKIMVMNNMSLGLIRTYQNIVFRNAVGSVDGFSSPDYRLLAKSYGIRYMVVETVDDILKLKNKFLDNKPLLVEVKLSCDTEVHPEPAYQKPVYIQAPLVKEESI